MKIRYITIILIFTVLSGYFLFENYAYGMWVPLTTQQLLEQSETIFVGNVTSVAPVDVQYQSQWAKNGTMKQSVGPETMTLDEYTIHVEKFLQNPQQYDTINLRQATVGGVPTGPSTISGFEVGDRVLFFVPKYENQTHFPMQYLPESFKIPQSCNGEDVLEQKRIIGSNNFTVIQDGTKADFNNFTVSKPIKFTYEKDVATLFGKSFDVKVDIAKVTDQGYQLVFSKEIHAGSKLCQWITSASWEFTPKEVGKYTMNIMTKTGNDTGGSMSQTPFYVKFDKNALSQMSPLEQFRSGIKAEDVQCNPDFILAISRNYSPACVTETSAEKLLLRGWAFGFAHYIPVYFANPDTTSQITVEYFPLQSNDEKSSDITMSLNARFYKSDSIFPTNEINATARPNLIHTQSDTSVNYTITTQNTKGVYWLSLEYPCNTIPIAVGIDSSQMTGSDLQNPSSSMSCPPAETQYHVSGISNVTMKLIRID